LLSKELIAKATRTAETRLQRLWMGFIGAAGSYLLIAFLMSNGKVDSEIIQSPKAIPILFVISMLAIIFAFLFIRRSFDDPSLCRVIGRASGFTRYDHRTPDAEMDALLRVMPYIQTRYIIAWACLELVAICGFAVVFFLGRLMVSFSFFGVAMMGIYMLKPKTEEILDRAQILCQDLL